MTSDDTVTDPDRAPATLPDPPDGYGPAQTLTYPTVRIQALALALTLVGFLGGGALHVARRGGEAFRGVVTIAPTASGEAVTIHVGAVLGVLLVAVALTVVCHEAVHAAVLRFSGYDPTFGVASAVGGFYAAAFDEYVSHRDTARVLVAPLLVLDAVALALLLAGPGWFLALFGWALLTLNTGGAAADCWALWRLREIDDEAVFYDVDLRHSYYFEPER
ncbi:DUF3267 domain-containing protein [Halarchaeum sp. CBA1220]|uniref:DUF3267 domain-containing protein n=1 Tax=Halarchaeum sp. CBA1220 TaxID=1853682 RepID=UPI00131489E7|nr:DUF3267 domain-containing protein [Halarchaeum sp. CBA1220]QLC34151.1 DUF3267 domain-containing protein [Halarchaeum sp. CBA1220]